MSQDLKSPWYPEFAANNMANIVYRIQTLQERGLLLSMKNECWVNDRLPENTELLSRILGFTEKEVRLSLPGVMSFFAVSEGYIFCPELESKKKELFEKKEKAKINGARGAAITNGKRKGPKSPKKRTIISDDSDTAATLSDTPRPNRQGESGVLSYIKSNTIKSNVSLKEKVVDPFVAEMEAEEAAKAKIVRRVV